MTSGGSTKVPVALVTGAARRIGRVLAIEAARAGFDIALHHRDSQAEADATAAEIRALGRRAQALSADLSDLARVGGLVERAAEALGPVTLLVNNASLFEDDRLGAVTPERLGAHLSINLEAPILLAQAMAATLPAGAEGLVVNLLDQRVKRPNPQFFSYTLSKSALWAATRTLAQALAPRVRVNGIGPGPTFGSVHQAPGEFEAEAAGTPLGRPVDPDELGHALRYLIDAKAVTGQMIAVDSGQHLGWRTPDIVAD